MVAHSGLGERPACDSEANLTYPVQSLSQCPFTWCTVTCSYSTKVLYSPYPAYTGPIDTPPDASERCSGYACGTPRRCRLTGQPGPTVRWSVRRGFVDRPYQYPLSPRGEKPASPESHSSPGSAAGPSGLSSLTSSPWLCL